MTDSTKPDKKSEKTVLDMLKEILSGKKPDPSEPKYIPKNKSLYKILVCLGILALVLAGVVFALTYFDIGSNSSASVSLPALESSTYTEPTSVSTPKPTPTPTPASESSITLSDLFVGYHPSEVISVEGSFSMEDLLGDTKDIWKEMQNMTMGVSIVDGGNVSSVVSGSLARDLVADGSWSLNSSPFDVDTFRDSYLTLYQKDADTGVLVQEDKMELTPEVLASINKTTYSEGDYVVLISNDPDCVLSAESTIYTRQLSMPSSGTLFDVAPNYNTTQADDVWKTVTTKDLEKSAWKVHELHIQVTPAEADQTAANGGWNTITIAYPWRIVWEITGASDETEPYTNAEFVLCNLDGSVVDKFGWKGFYSSQTKQNSRSYQPGDYVLAVYLRGCGVKLEFQHTSGPVYMENSIPISGDGK